MSKYYIYSDESGKWQDDQDIYVRSWVCVDEENRPKIEDLIGEIRESTGCSEVKWRTAAAFNFEKKILEIDFKVFISVTEMSSFKDDKYFLTRTFEEKVGEFEFGGLRSDTVDKIKEKMYKDIRYVLFLHIYESLHLKSTQEIFNRKFPDAIFEYIVDPPPALNRDWSQICEDLTGYKPSFPDSKKEPGVQFADIIAGAWRSFLKEDNKLSSAENLICKNLMPNKMLYVLGCPNPNLIIHSESSDKIKNRCSVSNCGISD